MTRSKEVVVDKLVPGGQGLCRDEEGVFFVDGTAAGDLIQVVVERKRRGAREARLISVLQPSPDRGVPDCALFSVCGGCDWLHLTREAQTRCKQEIVADALQRVGRFPAVDVAAFMRPLLVPGAGARRRARFVVDAAGRLAFFARRSHERVTIPACLALESRLSATLSLLPRLTPGAVVRLALDDSEGVVAGLDNGNEHDFHALASVMRGVLTSTGAIAGDPFLRGEITAGLLPARSDALSFAQATRFGGASIRDEVLAAAGDVNGKQVLELFAGAGHLSLPLARVGAIVDAVEGDQRALDHLRHNAELFHAQVTPRRAFIDEHLSFGPTDVVIADPPRTGIPGAASLFRRLTARRLVLVSCDPATGARDLRAAADAGFVVDALTPIDAFPRTHHVEWVAVLSRS